MNAFYEFASLNKKEWENEPIYMKKCDNILVYVGGNFADSVIECMMTAKKLALKKKCGITVLDFCNSSCMAGVYKSFGINEYINIKINLYLKIMMLMKAILFCIKVRKSEKLLKYEEHGLLLGELLYDYIIRSHSNLFTIDTLKFTMIKDVADFFMWLYFADMLIDENKYDTYLYCDGDYKRNVFPRLCKKRGIAVLQVHCGRVYIHKEQKKQKIQSQARITKEIYNHYIKTTSNEEIELFLNSYFSGQDTSVYATAFRDKKIYTKNELFRKVGLQENGKKNILVAPHAFSDSPHIGYNMLYRDYYIWLVETLKILSRNSNVNVFVKEHPSAFIYGETGSIKRIITKYCIDNIFTIPKDFNTSSVFSIMDFVITCQGTIGLEAVSKGIPVITASQGYYYGFDVDINAKSIEEYENILMNFNGKVVVNNNQIKTAKELLFVSAMRNREDAPDVIPPNRFENSMEMLKNCEKQYEYVNDRIKNGVSIKGKFYDTIFKDRVFVFDDQIFSEGVS